MNINYDKRRNREPNLLFLKHNNNYSIPPEKVYKNLDKEDSMSQII